MNTIQSQSYSLLSQEEIDVLVDFLNARKGSVNSDVMSQKSIDKLIYLITSDKQQIIKDLCNPLNDVNSSLLETMHFRENFEEICTLSCTTDPQTGFLKLTATNTKNGKTLAITPKLFDENDSEEWGVCISPLMFNHLARVLSLVYTTETHERICSIFAKGNYNDENYPIPAFYMPTNVNLLEMLID
jgi:hypothetical protein